MGDHVGLGRLLPLLLVACSWGTVPVAVPSEVPAEQVHAVERFGLPVRLVDSGAPIVVTIVDKWPEYLDARDTTIGKERADGLCRRRIWLLRHAYEEHPAVLAHEIGHALGLGHVDDRQNFMHPQPVQLGGGEWRTATRDQVQTMRMWAAHLRRCGRARQ